jgi:hypothetical protein
MAAALSPHVILLVYWLLLVICSAFFLRMACSLCRTTIPSWRRAFVSVFLVAFLSYLAVDFTSYLLLRSMQGVLIQIPPWYGYSNWFREPIGLKWFIISKVGPLRYLPFVFGLCAAGFFQFIILQAQITFRWGLLIVLLQWGATFITGYILSLVFGVALSSMGWTPQPPTGSPVPGPVAAHKGRTPTTSHTQTQGKKPPAAVPDNESGGELSSLAMIQQEGEAALRDPRESFDRATTGLKTYANLHLEQLKEDLAPVTKYLPESLRDLLDRGGWWVVLGVAAIVALVWLRSIMLRVIEVFAKRKRRKKKKRGWHKVAVNLKENLKTIGEAQTEMEEGWPRLLVNGLPARLRLVILSLGSRNAGDLTPEMSDRVLDWIKPGLAEVCAADFPRVSVWPPFYSASGFETAVAANVRIPAPEGDRSPWVVVTGRVRMGKALVYVALGLYADEINSLRYVRVKGDQWLRVLAVKGTKQTAGAR